MAKTYSAGVTTAYGAAKRGGYTGTYEEFCSDLAQLADVLSEFLGFSVTVQTLAEGASATASYDDGVLALGIPRGNTGNGIQSIVLNADYTLTVTYTNGNTWTSGSIRGQVGATPHLTIGTVQTLEPGQSATAEITGTDENPVLNLGIPKGQAGASDAGSVSYDPESSYNEGTVGAELQNQTRQISDLEDTVSTTQIINTASGDIASFADGADGMPVKSLVANIEPVQDLHGYDNPWPAGGGANKFSLETINANAIQTFDIDPVPAGTYVFSSVVTCTNTEENVAFIFYDADGNTLTSKQLVPNTGTRAFSSSFTISAPATKIALYSGGGWGGAQGHTSVWSYNMLADASVRTYSPYSNICPISGHTGCEVTRTGKNLSDTEQLLPTSYWGGNHNALVDLINSLPVGTYTFSHKATVLTLPDSGVVQHGPLYVTAMVNGFQVPVSSYSVAIDSSPTVGKVYKDSTTFTITEANKGKCNHVYAYCDSSVHTGTGRGNYQIYNIQLELGSTVTDYEPFQSKEISVNWETEAGTVYGGTLDVVSGKMILTYRIITCSDITDFASLSTLSTGVMRGSMPRDVVIPSGANLPTTAIMDRRLAKGWSPISTADVSNFAISPTKSIVIPMGREITVEEFLDEYANAQICYPLATPVEYQLTPQEIRTLLGTNNVWADTGDIAECEYPADTKLYIDGKIADAIAALNS
jgi:hypothetical protein